jgi:hypothetical protein
MKAAVSAMLLAASLAGIITAPANAHAECGDPDQPACTGPVPTVDEVVAVMAGLTDPDIPAANKTNIVTPGFSPDEAGIIDEHLTRMNAFGVLPLPFVVTDIQPAPANLAGATLETNGGFHQGTHARPIVLVDQGGHWLITHDSAMAELDVFWRVANRSGAGGAQK